VLKVPMDALSSLEGRSVSFYIYHTDDDVGRLSGTDHVPPKGSVVLLELDTLTYNDSDGDGIDDTWERQHLGSLQWGPDDDINGDGVTNIQHQTNQTDPGAPVWAEADDGYMETCVFHPVVFQNALADAEGDGWDNRIRLQADPFDELDAYAGNFSYFAIEDYHLEIL
jgi:hypothetical protein